MGEGKVRRKSAPKGRKSARRPQKSAPKAKMIAKKRVSKTPVVPAKSARVSVEKPHKPRAQVRPATRTSGEGASAKLDASSHVAVLESLARELAADQAAGVRRPETLVRLRRALAVVLDALDAYDPEA